MRHEQDIPSKPTVKEWLKLDPEIPHYEALEEEIGKRGFEPEPTITDSFTDTTIPFGEND